MHPQYVSNSLNRASSYMLLFSIANAKYGSLRTLFPSLDPKTDILTYLGFSLCKNPEHPYSEVFDVCSNVSPILHTLS